MPTIRAVCPHCGQHFNMRESSLGVVRKCPACNGKIVINLNEDDEALSKKADIVVALIVIFVVLVVLIAIAFVWTKLSSN